MLLPEYLVLGTKLYLLLEWACCCQRETDRQKYSTLHWPADLSVHAQPAELDLVVEVVPQDIKHIHQSSEKEITKFGKDKS